MTAFKITVPNTRTHRTIAFHNAEPIWFFDGIGYAPEGHPGIDKIRQYGNGHDGQLDIRLEQVDAIPPAYLRSVEDIPEPHRDDRWHGWPRGGPLARAV